jgi:hypothetical protein
MMENIDKTNKRFAVLFLLWCHGILAVALSQIPQIFPMLTKIFYAGWSPSGSASIPYLWFTYHSLLFIVGSCLLWFTFAKALADSKISLKKISLFLIAVYTLKVILLFTEDKLVLVRLGLVGWAGLWIFLPYYLSEQAQTGNGWSLFKRYGWLFGLPDLSVFLVFNWVRYSNGAGECLSIYPYLFSIVVYVLFFKYFSHFTKGFKYCLNWGEMNKFKWLLLSVFAFCIGLPSFVAFYVFF